MSGFLSFVPGDLTFAIFLNLPRFLLVSEKHKSAAQQLLMN